MSPWYPLTMFGLRKGTMRQAACTPCKILSVTRVPAPAAGETWRWLPVSSGCVSHDVMKRDTRRRNHAIRADVRLADGSPCRQVAGCHCLIGETPLTCTGASGALPSACPSAVVPVESRRMLPSFVPSSKMQDRDVYSCHL